MKVSDGSGVRAGKSGAVARIGGKAEGRAAPAPPAADILGEARGPPAADDGGRAVRRPVTAFAQRSPPALRKTVELRGAPARTAPTPREARLAGAREESRWGAPRPPGSPGAPTPRLPPCLRGPSLPSQHWTLEGTDSLG